MNKQKTRKSIQKRLKVSSSGKILRRHQLGAGHLKRKKGKSALERQKKTSTYFKGDAKSMKRGLGI
ncbi:MAG: 50S ribosomal protein L35 [Candidatus Daviesbacteria bacterium]|nr:50S ribosomal protein L35 [Candidatus Daviesbacteria bacterium]